MSACYAPPAGATATAAESPAPASALVAFAGPAPQARLTVAVRIFMVIPQFVVLALLSLAAYVVTVIGWFGALFTGRLPVFAADFLTGYLRWMTRVYAYTFLLTDVYPPFSLDDVDYPVRVAVAPGRLNRLAVLFRFFLLIPCGIVVTVLSYGAFASQLRGIAMPSGRAQTADAALAASVSRTAGIFARLGAATSATQYIRIANAAGLQQSVNQLNQDYTNLSNALRS